MKRMTIISFLLICGLFATAQQGMTKITVSHATSLGIGSFGDFIGKASPRGFSADLQYFINDKVSAGLNIGYADFYEKFGRQLYNFGGEDVSAVKTHSVQTIPILAKVGYNKLRGDNSIFQPYAALGIGMNVIMYEEWWGSLVDQQNKWAFVAAPEIGTRIAFNKYSAKGIDIALRYHYSPVKINDVRNVQTISLNVGFFWFGRN